MKVINFIQVTCTAVSGLFAAKIGAPLFSDRWRAPITEEIWSNNIPSSGLPLRSINQSEVKALKDHGFVKLDQVLQHEWLQKLKVAECTCNWRTHFDGLKHVRFLPIPVMKFLDKVEHKSSYYLSARCKDMREILWFSPIVNIAQQVSGAKTLNFAGDVSFRRSPGSIRKSFQTGANWHTDFEFMDINAVSDNDPVLIVWIPMHRIKHSEGASALEFIPSSHKFFIHDRKKKSRTDLIVKKHRNKAVILNDFEVGDILVFYSTTVHRSTQQDSTVERFAMSYRFATEDARYKSGGATNLVSGLQHGDYLGGLVFPKMFPNMNRTDWPHARVPITAFLQSIFKFAKDKQE
eukprot:CAMPEP_0194284826 /NCGR_PEP_ID=MMETSP0169-20130528/28653_1 /TAXON_ID=218684 /ORGANISM="Corethron pennatum, Strain L29A3" /LENGTH=348 /DNA_ID=CAMNT_0039030763 /DNA_START=24 /DNA_END=1070 /DNA_ORIENTATION=+